MAGVRLLRLSGPFPPFRSVLRVSGDSLRRGPGRLVLESDLAPRRLPFGAPTPRPLPLASVHGGRLPSDGPRVSAGGRWPFLRDRHVSV